MAYWLELFTVCERHRFVGNRGSIEAKIRLPSTSSPRSLLVPTHHSIFIAVTSLIMDFDGALRQIGEFGWHQKKIFILLSLAAIPCSYQMLVLVFVAATPKWSCQEESKASLYQCRSMENCCSLRGSVCDRALFKTKFTSIATEWNLLCGEAYKNELAQSIYMLGLLIGAPVIGGMADKHGRRKVWFVSYFFSGGFAFLSGLSPSYTVFVALRFLVGIFVGGFGLVNFVLCTESIGPSYRGKFRCSIPVISPTQKLRSPVNSSLSCSL